jgi:acyl carrier protein
MSLLAKLNALFLDKLNVKVPGPDTDLIESRLLDSLQIVELLVQIEQQFGLRIELEQIEIDDLRSVRGIARMIGNAAPGAGANAPASIGTAASATIGNAMSSVMADAASSMIEDAAPIAAAG